MEISKHYKDKSKKVFLFYYYKIIILPILIILFYSILCNLKYVNKKEILIKKLNNFTSYSQCYEDLILYCIFYNIKKGFYIDIGANDPNEISVTKAFYLNGWNGINIEPLPEKYLSLLKSRSKDINLQIGVGEYSGNATLYASGAGSTLYKKYLKNSNKEINITIDTMSNVCNKYIKKNLKIQFCKIDVEGNEKNVLLGYDFNKCRAEIFLIESTLPATNIPSYSEWENILLKNDYSFVYQYSINRFYVDNKNPSLKKKFEHIDEYIKLYEMKKINK